MLLVLAVMARDTTRTHRASNAAKHYDADQLAALVTAIAVINAYNRFNVMLKNQGGDYQPGQWA